MLFFPRGRGSNASDDSDDYQPLARGLLWDGNRLRTDPVIPPPIPPTDHNPITSYDALGLDDDDDSESGNDSGDNYGSDLGFDWGEGSETDDVPSPDEETWYQLTDTYGVEFAIDRLMDPYNSLHDRAELANQLIGLLAIIGEWTDEGLRRVRKYIVDENLEQPSYDDPIYALICYARQPEQHITGEVLLKSMMREPVYRTVDYHMCQPGAFYARSKGAAQMVTLWKQISSYVDHATTYLWEEIIARENLWEDCGGEAQLKFKIGYDCSDYSPMGRWRSDLGDIDRSHADLVLAWGEGWEKRLDPTDRWVPRASRNFLLLLSTMASTGWCMAEIRDILDLST